MSRKALSTVNLLRGAALLAVAALLLMVSVSPATAAKPVNPKLAHYQAAEKLVAEHLATFDELDYVVFSGRDWARLHESHSQDVIVHWPDGHFTKGIQKHIEDLDAMFVYAPDTRIKVHPVKVGQGDRKSVV
jgi:predicted phage-related endonuclease